MTRKAYYDALQIHTYQRRAPILSHAEDTPSLTDWQQLKSKVASCTLCPLHQSRTNAVFGVGNEKADLMIIGEAPGFNEDKQGEPFVGRAGKLLNEMLKAISLSREKVYIANIIKCRPPNNRDPNVKEVETCSTFLDQQIIHIKPKLLLAVGRVAAHYLLKNKVSLESLRQCIHKYTDTNTPLIITYHPAYLLRNLIDKKKAYSDLKLVQRVLEELAHGDIPTSYKQTLPRHS